MKNYPKVFIILIFFSLPFNNFISESFAQSGLNNDKIDQIWEAGLPPITQYTPEDYKAHIQNWCFIQDNNGIIYAGNISGILEFDGNSWRLIKLPNGSPVKSFAKTADGTIYAGAVRDLGYLKPDSIGSMKFYSLLSQLDSAYRNFEDIWFTYAIGNDVFFISDYYIFKWYNNTFKVWKANQSFGFAGLVRDQIYIESKGIGLMHLKNDTLKELPDGDKFLNKKGSITAFLPYDEDKILLGHNIEGIFLYDNNKIIPVKVRGQNLLYKKHIYGGVKLQNGDFAFITLGNGCFILDKHGYTKQWLGKENGLASDVIISSYVDKGGSLWLATEKGIDRIEISSPFRIFDQRSGLSEGIEKVIYQNNRLYAASRNGLFYLNEIYNEHEKKEYIFQGINGLENQTWDISAKGKYLMAGNYNGIYQIDPENRVRQIIPENTLALHPSLIDTSRIYGGTSHGNIYILELANNQWKVNNSKLSVEGRIIKIQEAPDSTLWISTRYNGIYKLDWSPSNINRIFSGDYKLSHYDTSSGLPEMSYNVVYRINGELYFTAQSGIFNFNKNDNKFEPDKDLMQQIDIPSSSLESLLGSSADGSIWIAIVYDTKNYIYKYKNGIVKEIIPFKRFNEYSFYNIYEYKDIAFFAGPKGIVCYNKNIITNYNTLFSVKLRNVIINNDLTLFAGHSSNQNSNNVTLSYDNNSIRFSYSLPDYDKPESNQYRYYLEGYSKRWSDWSTESQRDFTNLSGGDYIFRVKGKNIYGQISPEAIYAFTITPPWHRTLWAYLLYILAGSGIVGLIVQWRSRHLKHEKEELEKIVDERTNLLTTQAKQLAEQAEQLKEADRQKGRFFANISHEFRTPLTLIKGPIEQVLQTPGESLSQEEKLMIHKNANRLLRLVNQLLDLSKLDANNLELNLIDGDIFGFLRVVSSAFSSHAEQRNINYDIRVPEKELHTLFDQDKLEKIIYNLLSNAFKFTPDNGEVSLSTYFKNDFLKIDITDTGKGISSEHLPFIFNRFFQSDNSITREYEGTGIGLSLTKELVTLMRGKINVESQPGKGSKFTVIIPIEENTDKKGETARKDYKLQTFFIEEEIKKTAEINIEEKNEEKPIILIVEDNKDMRGFIRKQLIQNYNILEASDGEEGFKTAKKEIPDLVITDLMMPKLGGIDFCEKLKNDDYTDHIPVIMLTAKTGQEHKIEGLETGADDYLTKPFDRKELQTRVYNLIHLRQELRKKFSREIILQPRNINISSMDEKFLKKLENLIEENISDEKFGVPEMQTGLAMSKTQLHRKMKAIINQAPGEFLRNYRLMRAAKLISGKSDSITQIAYSVGFGNLSYFTKCFKELFGVIPSEYDNQLPV